MTHRVGRLLRIRFPRAKGHGGPSIFLDRLRTSIREQELGTPRAFYNPFTDINICSNVVRNPWRRPFAFRVDGVYFDSAYSAEANARRNAPLRYGIQHALGIVYQSEYNRRMADGFLGPATSSSSTIPNGVDLRTFCPEGPHLRGELGLSSEDLVFVTSAKWRAHKRLGAVIRAFARFQAECGSRARLVVLGRLETAPAELPHGVHLIGHVPPADLPRWYRTGNAMLFFSWLDHCPNTVLEAMGSGLPVLCTNQGGTPELVASAQGGIVSAADAPLPIAPVDLYHPPEPDMDVLHRDLCDLVRRRRDLAAGIRRDACGIDAVARRYVAFLVSLLGHRGQEDRLTGGAKGGSRGRPEGRAQ